MISAMPKRLPFLSSGSGIAMHFILAALAANTPLTESSNAKQWLGWSQRYPNPDHYLLAAQLSRAHKKTYA